jgi:SRSO17 transposase
MDWESSFDGYLEHLCEALQHNDRNAGLIGYCQGLMLPLRRKSVEPLAARLEPDRVSARHQSLHHFVSKSEWSDAAVLESVPAMGAASHGSKQRDLGMTRFGGQLTS